MDTQAELANNVIRYWQDGYGGQHHPDRKEAFRTLSLVKTIDEAISNIKEETGNEPYIITTDARIYPNTISYSHLRKKIENDNNSYLILFGTGWGIENKIMAQFNYILEPIYGPVDYNHLPVRAAVAIILDRLLGELWWEK